MPRFERGNMGSNPVCSTRRTYRTMEVRQTSNLRIIARIYLDVLKFEKLMRMSDTLLIRGSLVQVQKWYRLIISIYTILKVSGFLFHQQFHQQFFEQILRSGSSVLRSLKLFRLQIFIMRI